jgi:hypothetical protein
VPRVDTAIDPCGHVICRFWLIDASLHDHYGACMWPSSPTEAPHPPSC